MNDKTDLASFKMKLSQLKYTDGKDLQKMFLKCPYYSIQQSLYPYETLSVDVYYPNSTAFQHLVACIFNLLKILNNIGNNCLLVQSLLTLLYYTILYFTKQYYTKLNYTTLYYTILYHILYHTTLYYTILNYTILHYNIQYYT